MSSRRGAQSTPTSALLGWILDGINAHEELSGSWVFKGGDCLKKCYFETYRFSEDLDFTLRDESHIDEDFLRPVFEEARCGPKPEYLGNDRLWTYLQGV